jgi:hypothetical protein
MDYERKKFSTSVNVNDYGEAMGVDDFIKRVEIIRADLLSQGYSAIEIGLESVGLWAEDGSTIVVFGSRLETDEELAVRMAEKEKRSLRSKQAWEKRRIKWKPL